MQQTKRPLKTQQTSRRCLLTALCTGLPGALVLVLVGALALGQETKEPPSNIKLPSWATDARAGTSTSTMTVTPNAIKDAPAASTGSTFVVPEEPTTTDEVVSAARRGFAFAVARNWCGLSACVIFVIMFFLKTFRFGGQTVFERYGKRVAYIIPPILSIIAMLLANLAGNVSWNTVWLVLTSGPVAAACNDIWKRGIMGQEHTTLVGTGSQLTQPVPPVPPVSTQK